MALGENIRHYREKANMSQTKLAEEAQITQQAISMFETGLKVPNLESAVKIARALSTTVDQLVYGERVQQ